MRVRIAFFAQTIFVLCLSCMALAPVAGSAAGPALPRLAIIIDDIGYNLPLGRRAVQLPGPMTYAILPHTPQAARLAEEALLSDPEKEIIVHMPMQSRAARKLGPGGLRASQPRHEFVQRLREAIDAVPGARGLSNHMGSHLTTLPDRMRWLMDELQRSGLYYLDSRTVSNGMARQAAINESVPYMARDVFLDHDRDPEAIAAAFERALGLARQQGLAVVLAHPYRNTLQFLEKRLPGLRTEGIVLVNASTAVAQREELPRLALDTH